MLSGDEGFGMGTGKSPWQKRAKRAVLSVDEHGSALTPEFAISTDFTAIH